MKRFAAAFGAILLILSTSIGATLYWTGGTSTDWNVDANWGTTSGGSDGTVPTTGDSVVLDNNSTVTCSLTVNTDIQAINIISTCTRNFKTNKKTITVVNGLFNGSGTYTLDTSITASKNLTFGSAATYTATSLKIYHTGTGTLTSSEQPLTFKYLECAAAGCTTTIAGTDALTACWQIRNTVTSLKTNGGALNQTGCIKYYPDANFKLWDITSLTTWYGVGRIWITHGTDGVTDTIPATTTTCALYMDETYHPGTFVFSGNCKFGTWSYNGTDFYCIHSGKNLTVKFDADTFKSQGRYSMWGGSGAGTLTWTLSPVYNEFSDFSNSGLTSATNDVRARSGSIIVITAGIDNFVANSFICSTSTIYFRQPTFNMTNGLRSTGNPLYDVYLQGASSEGTPHKTWLLDSLQCHDFQRDSTFFYDSIANSNIRASGHVKFLGNDSVNIVNRITLTKFDTLQFNVTSKTRTRAGTFVFDSGGVLNVNDGITVKRLIIGKGMRFYFPANIIVKDSTYTAADWNCDTIQSTSATNRARINIPSGMAIDSCWLKDMAFQGNILYDTGTNGGQNGHNDSNVVFKDLDGNKYLTPSVPTLTTVKPTSGTVSGGDRCSLTVATELFSPCSVSLDGGTTYLKLTVVDSTKAYFTTPAHAKGAVNFTVKNADNKTVTKNSAYTFRVIVSGSHGFGWGWYWGWRW